MDESDLPTPDELVNGCVVTLTQEDFRWYRKLSASVKGSFRYNYIKVSLPEKHERKRQKNKQIRRDNPEKCREWKKNWNAKNPEKLKAIHKKSGQKKRSTPEGRLNEWVRDAIKENFYNGAPIGNLKEGDYPVLDGCSRRPCYATTNGAAS